MGDAVPRQHPAQGPVTGARYLLLHHGKFGDPYLLHDILAHSVLVWTYSSGQSNGQRFGIWRVL